MAERIYKTQIQQKIVRLEREREQVLKHLMVVDRKLSTLRGSLEVMASCEFDPKYNTENFTYSSYARLFKGKLRQHVLDILKNEPTRYFTVNELVKLILIKDNQPYTAVTARHCLSVRNALNHWLNKNAVERVAKNATDVKWKLKVNT